MLHTKVQVSEQSGSGEEDFLIFSLFFSASNQGPPGLDDFGPRDLHSNKYS